MEVAGLGVGFAGRVVLAVGALQIGDLAQRRRFIRLVAGLLMGDALLFQQHEGGLQALGGLAAMLGRARSRALPTIRLLLFHAIALARPGRFGTLPAAPRARH